MTPKLLNILLIIISGILYVYIVDPLYSGTASALFPESSSIKTLTDTRNAYDATLKEVPNIISNANKAKIQYEKISEDDRKKIMTMVPVSINDIKLMSELTNIGVESGVPIDGMGIKDKGAGIYSVSFSVTTTYTNFKKIISFWENSMRLFRLESVSFSPGKTEEEPIKFSVELSTFYMK